MNRKIRTWVEISLNNLEHNYREISSRLPDGCQMLGVCKANAYGHGAVRVAQRLQRAAASGSPSTAMTRPRSCALRV